MALDASELLGAAQVAGTRVTPIASASKRAGMEGAGVLVSGVASKLLLGKKTKELLDSQTPKFGNLGFLAATDQELALIHTKIGVVKGKLGDVVARVPRSQVASAEMTGAMVGKLVVNFSDGTRWAFEVPARNKSDARKLLELFGAETIVDFTI